MLKTTSQQLIDSLGYEGGRVGQPILMSAALDQTTGNKNLLTVPNGQVFLCTHILVQADVAAYLLAPVPSPDADQSYTELQLHDPGGSNSIISLRGFARYSGSFNDGASPDFRTAPPGNAVMWKLKYPFAVPPGWSVVQSAAPTAWGNQSAIYGVMVSEPAARELGYHAENASPTLSRRSGITSAGSASGTNTVLTGVAGQCIRVLDVQLRMQPEAVASNQLTLQQGDGQKIFITHNDNPAEHLSMQFSPDWYLKAGQNLVCVTDDANANSINITYEYVDEDDVPPNSWFACIEPTYPTPDAGGASSTTVTVGTSGLPFTRTLNEVTCYYAKPNAAGQHTRTSPTKGFQHLVRGYAVSIQKDATTANATDDTEQTRFTISSGAAAGQIGLLPAGLAQTNYQIAPVFTGSAHDQCLATVIDGINIPGKSDDGSLWVDVVGFKALSTTPTSGTNDIAGFAVSLWGCTAPTFATPRSNKGV